MQWHIVGRDKHAARCNMPISGEVLESCAGGAFLGLLHVLAIEHCMLLNVVDHHLVLHRRSPCLPHLHGTVFASIAAASKHWPTPFSDKIPGLPCHTRPKTQSHSAVHE